MTNLRSEGTWLDGAYEGKDGKDGEGGRSSFYTFSAAGSCGLHSDIFSACESACAAISQLFGWLVVVEIAIRFSL